MKSFYRTVTFSHFGHVNWMKSHVFSMIIISFCFVWLLLWGSWHNEKSNAVWWFFLRNMKLNVNTRLCLVFASNNNNSKRFSLVYFSSYRFPIHWYADNNLTHLCILILAAMWYLIWTFFLLFLDFSSVCSVWRDYLANFSINFPIIFGIWFHMSHIIVK